MMLQELARRYAVGICVLAASGDVDAAQDATRMFLNDAVASGHTALEAMFALFQSSVGCAIAAADSVPGGATAYFSGCALGLAVKS